MGNHFADLPKETGTEPVQAWKMVRLRQRPNGHLIMSGVHLQTMHPVEGEAICMAYDAWGSREDPGGVFKDYCASEGDVDTEQLARLHKASPHVAPDETCRCGFYAWKEPKLMVDYAVSGYPDLVPIRVELWGRVLQYERGYRAQYQRVLGLYLPPGCSRCQQDSGVYPRLFKGDNGYGFLHMLCDGCTGLLASKLCDSSGRLTYAATWTLADIASRLHCEVSLMDKSNVNMRRMLSVASRNIHQV